MSSCYTLSGGRTVIPLAESSSLQQARATLSTVLNNLDALIYVADMHTYKVLFANDRLRQQFGDISGTICWQALQEGQSGPCDFCTNPDLLTQDGKPAGLAHWQFQNTRNGHWYAFADSAIEWVDERLVRLSMAVDITENKRAESRLLAQQRLVATLDERERVGRDLHDDLGQVMGYVNVKAQAAQDLLAQGRLEQVRATLSQLQGVAHEAHDKVRQYILGIRTARSAVPLDFWQALEQYLNKLRQRYGLQVHVDCPDALHDDPLAPDVETQLLHIIQERRKFPQKVVPFETMSYFELDKRLLSSQSLPLVYKGQHVLPGARGILAHVVYRGEDETAAGSQHVHSSPYLCPYLF